jgi:hypothetical protein
MEEYTGDDECFVFNLDNCIKDKTQPTVIRELFTQIQKYGYISVGDFFSEMHDSDLRILRDMVVLLEEEQGETPNSLTAVESLTLLGMGLTFGEGMVINEEVAAQGLSTVTIFISLEFLARSSMIQAMRENWSMDPTVSKQIAKKL